MAFSIPSLGDLSKRIRAGFQTEMPGSDATSDVWPNNLYVTGKVVAMGLFDAFLRLEWIYRQIFASTATGEHLDRHAYEVGLSRKAAVAAEGRATVPGKPGDTVPIGRRFLREDGGVYVTYATAPVDPDGTATLRLRAVLPGFKWNVAAASTLAPENRYDEITGDATVSVKIDGGANAESDEELRERVLYRKRNPPMGGAIHDYKIWAESVPGVRRAYAAAYSNGGKMIAVYPVGQGRGADAIPSQTIVGNVAALIEAERPVTASVTVTAPVAFPINVVINALSPSSQAVKDEIKRELLDMFAERAEVVLPGSSLTFPRSWIISAIDAAAGEVRHSLTTPAADVAVPAGRLPILGTITYT